MPDITQGRPAAPAEAPSVAVMAPEKPKSRNKGHNRYTNNLEDAPYSMRFAKASAMLQGGATYLEVQAETGLAPATIAKVRKGEIEVNGAVAETMRKCEVNKLTLFGHRILDSVDSEVIQKAPLAARMMAYGISVDKRELLAGRPTQRTAFVGKGDQELEAEINTLQDKIGAWEQGKIINTSTLEAENENVDNQQV